MKWQLSNWLLRQPDQPVLIVSGCFLVAVTEVSHHHYARKTSGTQDLHVIFTVVTGLLIKFEITPGSGYYAHTIITLSLSTRPMGWYVLTALINKIPEVYENTA